ncbi:MAG TPA: murein biosynthesis integral membrane protein MurJ [Burkholderiales bacterium]|jgi:putative peptidoglycan lipid II flippase|nr:murein biosynthesis integral membrane protein MurJ [Burkholderiales bacterium]
MNLLKALAAVSSMTLLSRILGLVRDAVIARQFGVSLATDAFIVAFRLPNFLRRIFAEGAFSQAFVPLLSEYRNTRSAEDTRTFVDHVSTLLAIILVLVSIAGILAAPLVVYLTAPGFVATPDRFQTTVELLRITFPYILFISLVSLAGGILNTWSRFSVPAFTPVLLNVSFIFFALFLVPYFDPPIKALAWAVFAGGVLQLGFLLPFLARIGMLPRLRLQLRDPGVWRLLKNMGPAILGVSVGQISLLISTIFASNLVTGSVTWLYYADRLMELPTGLLGVALGTILLPSLSKSHAQKAEGEYSQLLDWGLRLTFLLALPCATALAIIGVPLIATLFHHGAFEAGDVLMTHSALVAYSIGLLGLILVKVLAPGFYARQNIRTPVKIAVLTLVVTQAMNPVFIWGLGLGHAGLALAISLGACLNAGLLFYKLRRQRVFVPQPGWTGFLAKLLLALVLMAVALHFAMGGEARWLAVGLRERIAHLAGLVVLGAVVYLGGLALLGFRLRDFSRRAS